MKDEKEKWIEEVLVSMEGSQRATPRTGLLEEIEEQLFSDEAKVVSSKQWRLAMTAAAVVLIINIFSFYQIAQNQNSSKLVIEDAQSQSLLSNYKLYD